MKKILTTACALAALSISLPSSAGFFDTEAKTKNPIMLIPGIFAFDQIATIDMFYKIPDAIESEGGTVYTAKVNSFDSSVMRGEELIAQMEDIIASTPWWKKKITKFNLMGHSQGGLTGRYVMAVRPDLVASLTTLSSPHTGSPVADLMTDTFPPDTVQGEMFEAFANAVGDMVNLMSDNKKSKADIQAMLSEFNAEGAAAFNATYPAGLPTTECGVGPASVTMDGYNIPLYSWGGDRHLTNALDISDPLFALTGLAFEIGVANDGITGVCANHFGTVLNDSYAWNHIDANNHVLGAANLFETDPKTVFVNHANRLKGQGL